MNMYRTNACRTTTNKKGVDLKAKIDNNFEVIWTCTVLDENTIKVQFQEIDSDWNGELTLERKRII